MITLKQDGRHGGPEWIHLLRRNWSYFRTSKKFSGCSSQIKPRIHVARPEVFDHLMNLCLRKQCEHVVTLRSSEILTLNVWHGLGLWIMHISHSLSLSLSRSLHPSLISVLSKGRDFQTFVLHVRRLHWHHLHTSVVWGQRLSGAKNLCCLSTKPCLRQLAETDVNDLEKLANPFLMPEISSFFLGKVFEQDLSADMLILSR